MAVRVASGLTSRRSSGNFDKDAEQGAILILTFQYSDEIEN